MASRGIQFAPLENISLPFTHIVSSLPPIVGSFFTFSVLKPTFLSFLSPSTLISALYNFWPPKPFGHHLSTSLTGIERKIEYLFMPSFRSKIPSMLFPAISAFTETLFSLMASIQHSNSTSHLSSLSLGITEKLSKRDEPVSMSLMLS